MSRASPASIGMNKLLKEAAKVQEIIN